MSRSQLLFVRTAALLIVLLLASCGTPEQAVNKYYVIEKPDDISYPELQDEPNLKGFCELLEVNVYPAYESRNIANRSSQRELVYYSSHLWAVRPEQSLTLLLEDFISRSSAFEGASTRYWKIDPAYHLRTKIYQLEVIKDGKSLSAHLSGEFRLYDNSDKGIVLTHSFDRIEKMPKKNLNIFADHIGRIFHEEIIKFLDKTKEI